MKDKFLVKNKKIIKRFKLEKTKNTKSKHSYQ